MADLSPGSVFAGHRIEGVAGRGGMGIVYRATHLALDHVVALKVISPKLAGDPRFRRRFADECRNAVSLRHPNIVQIHHAGEEAGLLFVTMDLIEGTDLRGVLNREPALEVDYAVGIVSQLASALDAAHARGLVHRDIKPGNVMIERREEGEHVYLTDFGLARHVEATSGVTATGAFVGTLDYVAPEQIQGERVDARADVYSLACVLFELLTGNPPFASREDKIEKMYAHLRDEPPRAGVMRPDLPVELDLAVARALEKDPGARFPSAGDLARAAEGALEGEATVVSERSVATGAAAPGPPEATTSAQREEKRRLAAAPPPGGRPDDPPPGGRPSPRRRIALLALGALVIAAVVVALLIGGGDGGGEPEGPDAGEAPRPPAGSALVTPIEGVGGLPVELAAGEQGIWVTSRTGARVTLIETGFGTGDVGEAITVGGSPEGVAFAAGIVFVAVADEGEVARLNEVDRSKKRPLTGLAKPQGVAFADGSIWVTDYDAEDLIEFEPVTGKERSRTSVGEGPYGIAASEEAIWVTNRVDGTVSRVPLEGGDVAAFEVGSEPKGIAFAGDSIWVAVTGDDEVKRLDADGEVTATIGVADEPRGVAAGFDTVWVSSAAGVVTQIDEVSGEIVDEIELGEGLEGISTDDQSVWVANGLDGSVFRIDPDS